MPRMLALTVLLSGGTCHAGDLYVFAAEVDPYLMAKNKRDTDRKEPVRFARTFEDGTKRFYKAVETKVVTGKKADKAGVLDGFRWVRENVGDGDVGVVFLSAHGGVDKDGFSMALAGERDGGKRAKESVLWGHEVRNELARVKKGTVVLFLESCHGGALLSEKSRTEQFPNCAVVCASQANREASTTFGYSLINSMNNGNADLNKDGVVTLGEVVAWADYRVRKDSGGDVKVVVESPKRLANLRLVTPGK